MTEEVVRVQCCCYILVERPTWETRAEQYSDTVLKSPATSSKIYTTKIPDTSPCPNMTGRPGFRTMEMNGGSSAPYLACTPCVPLFCTSFNRGGNSSAFRLPGRRGIISIVRWNLRPVIFGVEHLCRGPGDPSGSFFHPNPPSLLILLSEAGSALSFLSLFFWKKARKTHQKTRISSQGKNEEFQKDKERKDREREKSGWPRFDCGPRMERLEWFRFSVPTVFWESGSSGNRKRWW